MKKNIPFGATLLLAGLFILIVRCSHDQETFPLNRNPVLPSTDRYPIIEGDGTLQAWIGASKTLIEDSLGEPVGTSIGLFIYRKDDVQYTIKYNGSACAEKIEFTCDRFLTTRLVGQEFVPLVCFDATYGEMAARMGAVPDTEYNLTWWYTSRGVGFIYDFNTKRITTAVVFSPSRADYHIDSLWVSDAVDHDSDGYYRSYRLNFDIDKTGGADSVICQFAWKESDSTTWHYWNPSTVYILGDTATDAMFQGIIGGGDTASLDFHLSVFTMDTIKVAADTIYGIREESPANDSLIVAPADYFPLAKGNRWNFSYSGRSYTSSNPPRTVNNTGSVSWTITDTLRGTADSIRIVIAETLMVSRSFGTSGLTPFDTTYAPPHVSVSTRTCFTTASGNGIWESGGCWIFVHDPSGVIPDSMLNISDTSVVYRGSPVPCKVIDPAPCLGSALGSTPDHFITANHIGPVEYHSGTSSRVGSSSSFLWVLDSAAVRH